jgi:hypothetical protein
VHTFALFVAFWAKIAQNAASLGGRLCKQRLLANPLFVFHSSFLTNQSNGNLDY